MVGGRLVRIGHDWVSPMFGPCISSAELEIHSDGRVLSIGQVTVWSSYVEYGAW
jgi:hypothetical protein